jgi:hypothetical protein
MADEDELMLIDYVGREEPKVSTVRDGTGGG